jgi:hypothetical protein
MVAASCRSSAAEQLLQPGVAYLQELLQQLQSGISWAAIEGAADALVCHHLMRVRAVLEGRLLLHQNQQRQLQRMQQQQQQQQQQGRGACAAGLEHGSGVSSAAAACHCAEADALADQLAAGAAMDEDAQDDSDSSPGPLIPRRQQRQGHESHDSIAGNGSRNLAGARAAAAAAAAAGDPAVQLLLTQMWPLLHCIITQHGAAGLLLYHYGKCCSQLLKVQPGLLLPQLQQVLQVVVAGAARPGGSSLLAEPFAAAIEVCCRQGSGVLLDSGLHIMQVSTACVCVVCCLPLFWRVSILLHATASAQEARCVWSG